MAAPWVPGTTAAPVTVAPSQGLYQWIYHTHEDAQEARANSEGPGEDLGGLGALEDQPEPGNENGEGGGDGSFWKGGVSRGCRVPLPQSSVPFCCYDSCVTVVRSRVPESQLPLPGLGSRCFPRLLVDGPSHTYTTWLQLFCQPGVARGEGRLSSTCG